MRRFNRQYGKAVGFRKTQKAGRLSGKINLPQTSLDSKLPSGGNTEVFAIRNVKDYLFGSFRKVIIAVKKPDGNMGVQKITTHLHIILEVFQRCVKIRRHTELPFGTAKHGNFFLFYLRPLFSSRGKRKNDLSRRNFGGNVNDEPVVGGDFNGLFNGHAENIA